MLPQLEGRHNCDHFVHICRDRFVRYQNLIHSIKDQNIRSIKNVCYDDNRQGIKC
jgi:hypothetical protein